MPSQKAKRPDDKRLKKNRPPERQAKPKPADQKTRWQQLIDGDIGVEDLTDEEVMRGKCQDRDGGWRGKPPAQFPRALFDAMRAEFHKRVNERLNEQVNVAINTLTEIAQNRRAAAPARVRASEVLIERVIGKVPDKVLAEVTTKKFEENIEGLFVDVPDEVAKKRQEKAG